MLMQGTMISKKNRIQNNAEETKINFFDPNAFGGKGAIGDEEDGNLPDQVDHQILEGKIDPAEWKKEIERTYQDLDNIEKEIELNRQSGGGGGIASGNLGVVEQGLEECRRQIELIIDLCKDIQGTCHQDVRKVFGKVAEKLEEDLAFIRRHEMRIN